jgi:two-component system, NarL family, nitrate/nitrite response regulator NarL
MTDVVILSPSASRREALRHALESGDVRVVHSADAGAFPDVGQAAAVLVLDGEDALDAVSRDEDEWPRALVLLVDEPSSAAIDELRRGGDGGWALLPRDAGPRTLRAAVLAAESGLEATLPRWPREQRHAAARGHPGVDAADAGDADDFAADDGGVVREALTTREVEVLSWMARGLSNREIGERLGISGHTAKFHVASVLAKLGAHNRADAVRRGIRRGLVAV